MQVEYFKPYGSTSCTPRQYSYRIGWIQVYAHHQPILSTPLLDDISLFYNLTSNVYMQIGTFQHAQLSISFPSKEKAHHWLFLFAAMWNVYLLSLLIFYS